MDRCGQTALHIASEEGHYHLVEMMITKYSTSIDVRDNSGWTPLFCACSRGRLQICEFLLAEGNFPGFYLFHRPNLPTGADTSITSNDKASVLHYFVRNKFEDNIMASKILQAMVANGADVNCQNINGETALHIAADRGNILCVEFLLRRGASPNFVDKYVNLFQCSILIITCTRYGETPLHHAARQELKEIAALLLDYGADRTVKGENGTALDVCSVQC